MSRPKAGLNALAATLAAGWLLILPFGRLPALAAQAGDAESKQAQAVRTTAVPAIDGRLDEPLWAEARWITDFVQKEPVEGAVPAAPTRVAFFYDDHALYVGARMDCAVPGEVPHPVTRRDQFSNAEHLVISLDTYHDRRTGVSFVLSSGGVRSDYYHPGDQEGYRDYGYDPVWEGKVVVDSAGWTAEMRIPFSQLRFNKRMDQVWGLNINRWLPARNEDVYWVVIPKNETGFFSRFGTLSGISGIRPSRRFELTPYTAANANFTSGVDATDPFHDGSEYNGRAGLDLKMGLGPNLTLDATVNPDFGQVEADPAEVNLSAFETFFSERRPFFLEGSQLLQGNGPAYFYSRRVGGTPRGEADGDFVDRPDNTTILGAAKVSGRLASGLSLGVLTAVTDAEYASTFDAVSASRQRVRVEPVTGFGVMRVQQEFGGSHSTMGVTLTGVERDVSSGEALAAQFNRRAYTGGVDWNLRFQGGKYELSGFVGGSHVAGDTAQIRRVQESSAHYFQRPDASHVSLDPTRTSLTGYAANLNFAKNGGAHWLYELGSSVESPGFELNDVGRLSSADDIDTYGNLRYRETRPGRLFHRWSVGTFWNLGWNFGGSRSYSEVSASGNVTFKDFSGAFLGTYHRFRALSDDLTRGGPLMGTPDAHGGDIEFWSPESGDLQGNIGSNLEHDEFGGWNVSLFAGVSLRPDPRWRISVNPRYSRSADARQYLQTDPGGSPATFGSRYVFGRIEQSTLSAQIRVNYALTPDLTIEGYLEPFAASGRYSRIGELATASGRALRLYGTDGTTIARDGAGGFLVTDNAGADTVRIENPDFNVLSFRSNLVLRWEWTRGSTFFLVWQQDRSGFDTRGRRVRLGDLWHSVRADGDNFLALKLTYWVPVL